MGRPEGGRHDQLGHVPAEGLLGAVAERRLGRTVPTDDTSAVIHRHDRIERRLEHRTKPRLAGVDGLFGVSPHDELPDLAAELAHRREQPLVRLAQLLREELHHPHDAPRAVQREAEGRVQAAPPGDVGPRKVRVLGSVNHPFGLTGEEHLAGQPDAFISGEKRLARDNLSNVAPTPFNVWMFSTHPPTVERIEMAEQGRGHGGQHARMGVAGAGAKKQARRRVELTGDGH